MVSGDDLSVVSWYNEAIMKNVGLHRGITIELIPDPDIGGFTAHIPDIPAYGEGETEEEAIADLKVGLAAYIEEMGIQNALERVQQNILVRHMDIDLAEFVQA